MGLERLFGKLKKKSASVSDEGGLLTYQIGSIEIEVPPSFCLPRFQSEHRLYDRFLPVLAECLDQDSIVIDVGANIGDTAIAMMQKCRNNFVCIEASELFAGYLNRNIERLPEFERSRLKVIQKFVGTGGITGELKHAEGGTATLSVASDSAAVTHVALDLLVNPSANVGVIKVDTDGFDFDVISSAERVLEESEPVLFWENEVRERFQLDGFVKMMELLRGKGYSHFWVFDNFGNLMLSETGIDEILALNEYVYSMNQSRSTRTIYYVDVLATTNRRLDIAKSAIQKYRSEWVAAL
ncbi:MAG: FkbM family methyltransferase [Fibrobacterota bacterium]|nr:FkbM family methyltransferase [Fibrobacterota bacterium]QQS03693.1 MAG: FkbM family methyltransferase [Fibrobacterota bacterium]